MACTRTKAAIGLSERATSFENLPRELRDMVYKLAYTRVKPYQVVIKPYDWRTDLRCYPGSPHTQSSADGIGPLLVNKRFFDEAMPIMLSSTTFSLPDLISLRRFANSALVRMYVANLSFLYYDESCAKQSGPFVVWYRPRFAPLIALYPALERLSVRFWSRFGLAHMTTRHGCFSMALQELRELRGLDELTLWRDDFEEYARAYWRSWLFAPGGGPEGKAGFEELMRLVKLPREGQTIGSEEAWKACMPRTSSGLRSRRL